MQRSTPQRNPHASTSDLLSWPELPPPVSSPAASGHRSRQHSDKIGDVLRGGQLTDEEAQSLANKKPCSEYRMKEMTRSGIFSDNAGDAASEANSANSRNKTSIRVYQQAMNGISQISFNTEENISPKKPTSLPEAAKQRELGGTLQSRPDTWSRKQTSNAKTRELSGNDIFGPPPEIVPRTLAAARTLESKESKNVGESVPRHLPTSIKVSNPAAGQSNILVGEEPVKTSKKMHDQKFAELTGNDIFKDDVPPGLAEKHMSHSRAKLKEMAGSDIFADGKAENRDNILGARKEMAGSDIFADGKAENRNNILGARRPPGGGSSISLV